MREFLAIILARPSRNLDREYLGDKISFKGYLRWNFASLITAGILLLESSGDLQLFIKFFYESTVIFSGFFKIPGGICAVYLRRDFIARLNLQSHFKFIRTL